MRLVKAGKGESGERRTEPGAENGEDAKEELMLELGKVRLLNKELRPSWEG